MREEKLFRAIGLVDEELVEAADESSLENELHARKRQKWISCASLVAGIVLLLGVVAMWPKNGEPQIDVANKDTQVTTEVQQADTQVTTEVQQADTQITTEVQQTDTEVYNTEKPLMNFAIAFDGMGYEGIMGYEMPRHGSPWEEMDVITHLPIFKNTSVYTRGYGMSTEWLELERYEQMEGWLSEVMTFFEMEECTIERNRTECVVANEEIEISVDGDMHLRIEFIEGISLPKEYHTSTDATVEDTYEVAEYVLERYGELFAMENPQIAINESDYTFYATRYHHEVTFYEKGETETESLLNYYFSYAKYILNDEGKLWLIDIVRRDRDIIDIYETISYEEAKEKLLQGEYDTTYFGDTAPTEAYIREVELVYYMSFREDYKPYYKFWVEVPKEKRENGLNTYVAYYVPAIEGAYVEIMMN